MANGHDHARAAQRIVFVSVPITVALASIDLAYTGILAGALLGLFVDPDLDHHMTTQSEKRIYRMLGPVGYLWQFYWWPYQVLHPHRGSAHHWPLGTLVRFVYALWWPLWWSYNNYPLPGLFWLTVFVGLSVQDLVHLAMDGLLWGRRRRKSML